MLISDAAVLLGVSRRTVYYRIRSGRLSTIRTRGGTQRVLIESIANLMRTKESSEGGQPHMPDEQGDGSPIAKDRESDSTHAITTDLAR